MTGLLGHVHFESADRSLPATWVDAWTAVVAFNRQVDVQMPFQAVLSGPADPHCGPGAETARDVLTESAY